MSAPDPRRPLPVTAAILELARIAYTRLVRTNALWVVIVICGLPALLGVVVAAKRGAGDNDADLWRILFEVALPLVVVVPPVLVASAIADELEDKTSAYLWSRALPRWTVVIGKLLVLAPASALLVGGAGWLAGTAAKLPGGTINGGAIGMAAAAACAATVAAAIATLVPRHAMALTMAWLVVIDWPLHLLDFGVRYLSTTFGAAAIGGFTTDAGAATGGITLAVLAVIATAVACWRISKVE